MSKIISLADLAKRDKWICGICNLRVDRLADATREHKNPKAYGGTNSRDNLVLAHKWCNKAKGHKIFRAEQHGTGWVIVDPNDTIISDEYTSHSEAFTVASEMNRDKLYLLDNYGGKIDSYQDNSEIVIVRRVQDRPM